MNGNTLKRHPVFVRLSLLGLDAVLLVGYWYTQK